MTDEPSGKPPRKLPERADALKLPVDFDEAIKAALDTKPPEGTAESKKRKRKRG